MLIGIPVGLAAFFSGPAIFIRYAFAMGKKNYPQGMRRIRGDVRINSAKAKIGDIVSVGDTVSTGKNAEAVFVAKTSVYLLRSDTQIEISEEKEENAVVSVIRVIRGKMMSVFRKKKEKVITKTAIIGVRGTGLYVEAEPGRTYVCLCYGKAEIAAGPDGMRESLKTWHHEKPRYVNETGIDKIIEKAPVKNHSDAELIMLESLVGRKPPFLDDENEGNGGY